MNLINYIKENQINNYDDLKARLVSSPFNLKIKEDNDFPNLFLMFGQENSDYSNPIVNECNGIIMSKDTLEIACYSFNKCSDQLTMPHNLDKNKLYYENAVEGTLIRLFYFNNTWMISTKKCIDASKARWLSNRSFLDLFEETEQLMGTCITDLENINKDYCYSFILVHPENNIVIKYTEPYIYHIASRNMKTFKEEEIDLGIPKIPKTFLEIKNLEAFIEGVIVSQTLTYEGVVFIDENYNRWKLRTAFFNRARELWGNTNNRMFRYMELRKDANLLHEYLIYYPMDKELFYTYEYKIKTLASDILHNYIGKHVSKNIKTLPFYYTKIIYKLHGDFFKSKIKTDINKVGMTLLEIDAKQLCYIMNNYEKSLNKPNVSDQQNNDAMDIDEAYGMYDDLQDPEEQMKQTMANAY